MTLRYGSILTSLRALLGNPDGPEVQPTHAAVRYRSDTLRRAGIAPLADIYVPERATGASAVLVHGGGFVIGSRRMKPIRYLAAQLCSAGIAVCAIDYRMLFRGGRLDEATDDVRTACDFWLARAPELGLDARAVSIVGLSAGGTLALLAAARDPSARLAGLVCCFGMYDVDHLQGPAVLLPRLLFGTPDRAVWNERLPRFVAQPPIPTLLLHGSEDGLVPAEQARRLSAHRETLGLPTRLVIYEGAPHGFFSMPVPAAAAGAREIIDHVHAARAGERSPPAAQRTPA